MGLKPWRIARNTALFPLAALLLFASGNSTAAPPDFDAAADDAAPAVPATGDPGTKTKKSCDAVIAANKKLAEIVAGLELPQDVHEYYRGQSHKLYESARRLPAFVTKARDCLEGRSWICRMAQKYAEGHPESAGSSSFAVTWVAGKIQELFSGGSILAARPTPPAPSAPGASPASTLKTPGAPAVPGGPAQGQKDAPPPAATPYSNVALANIALGVAFNNLGLEVRQLVPEELLPLAEQVNDSAAAQGLLKIDAQTMKALKDLTDPAHEARQESVDQATQKLLKDAPDDFKAKVQEILALAVYRSPDGQTASNDAKP